MKSWRSARRQFTLALGAATLVSIGFFAYGAWRNHSFAYDYLPWDLFLAWLPLVFATWLTRILHRKDWSSWEGLLASVLWLLFLPNSFYMISDFIHLQDVRSVDLLYDAIMFTSFIYTAVLLGFTSLYLIHLELKKRMNQVRASAWIGSVLLFCSFGIYVGRDLRWNSWDVLTNPGGLLFDVSNRLANPTGQMFVTVISFFVLLSITYALVWGGTRLLRESSEP